MGNIYQLDDNQAPAIPEPFHAPHWIIFTRPACLQCHIKFRNRTEWELHWIYNHMISKQEAAAEKLWWILFGEKE